VQNMAVPLVSPLAAPRSMQPATVGVPLRVVALRLNPDGFSIYNF
jgi:hypothetical protein